MERVEKEKDESMGKQSPKKNPPMRRKKRNQSLKCCIEPIAVIHNDVVEVNLLEGMQEETQEVALALQDTACDIEQEVGKFQTARC